MLDGRGTADSHQTKYRADLDGLRAVAVLSVIAFHLSKNAVPGGYLGVDIFFVLSGYLITQIIWREALNRQFSVARFYERRVRRIMPALLALLIVVSAVSIVLLLPIDLTGYAKSVFASLAFVANLYFFRGEGYFERLAMEKPLLHVWSLGVEEQFYILFPLIVVLCIRWRRSALLPLTTALVLLSLIANFFSNYMLAISAGFYFLPLRAWEIGAGALLALAPPAKQISGAWLRQVLAFLAVALLIFGLSLKARMLGGLIPIALWVVLGTTLAIHLGTAGGNWLTRGLSNPVLSWIGLISYSLYLWHWPILVFAWYYLLRPSLTPLETVIAVALMFAMATLSWRFVERPFRNRSMPIGIVLRWVAGGCVVVAAASAAILISQGFPSRYSAEVARINAVVGTEYRCNLQDYVRFGASRGCLLASSSRNPDDATVALLGNSHAQMYSPLVEDILRDNHQAGILVPLNACLPMPDYNLSWCMDYAAKNLTALEGLPRVRVVILAMTWVRWQTMYTPAGPVSKEDSSKFLLASLDRLIQQLEQRGKTVVLVGPISPPMWDSASIVARELAFHHRVAEPLFISDSSFMELQGDVIAHYASRDDMIFIRPDRIQCQMGRCDYFRNGEALFADDNHLAVATLPMFRPAFEPALQKAFINAGLTKP
jgi:peptidoglycan/LPS O-acetylase OafA/YrhL